MILHNVFFSLSVPPQKEKFCPVWLTVLFVTSARGLHGQFSSDMTNTNTQNPILIESLHPVERKFLISFKVTLSPLKHGKGHDSPLLFFTLDVAFFMPAHPVCSPLPWHSALPKLPSTSPSWWWHPAAPPFAWRGKGAVRHHQAAESLCLLNVNQTSDGENYNHTSKYLSDQPSRALELNHGYFILLEGCIVVSTEKKRKKMEDNYLSVGLELDSGLTERLFSP